jgi:hypothetical protein
MKKLLFFVLVAFFIVTGQAYCHTFQVTAINEDATEAVLRDTVTGDEWLIYEGDEVDGYRIIKITMNYLTVVYTNEDGINYQTAIPINTQGVVKTSP